MKSNGLSSSRWPAAFPMPASQGSRPAGPAAAAHYGAVPPGRPAAGPGAGTDRPVSARSTIEALRAAAFALADIREAGRRSQGLDAEGRFAPGRTLALTPALHRALGTLRSEAGGPGASAAAAGAGPGTFVPAGEVLALLRAGLARAEVLLAPRPGQPQDPQAASRLLNAARTTLQTLDAG